MVSLFVKEMDGMGFGLRTGKLMTCVVRICDLSVSVTVWVFEKTRVSVLIFEHLSDLRFQWDCDFRI